MKDLRLPDGWKPYPFNERKGLVCMAGEYPLRWYVEGGDGAQSRIRMPTTPTIYAEDVRQIVDRLLEAADIADQLNKMEVGDGQ